MKKLKLPIKVSELKEVGKKRVLIEDLKILVCFVKESGEILVSDDTCTHKQVSLAMGKIEGCIVECPLHGARFNLKTGKVLALPAAVALKVYECEIVNDEIWIMV